MRLLSVDAPNLLKKCISQLARQFLLLMVDCRSLLLKMFIGDVYQKSDFCVGWTTVLLLGVFLWTRWKIYKGMKDGVYQVSAHHDGWEDIRENVLNYDEEGGGEEDQVRTCSKSKVIHNTVTDQDQIKILYLSHT